MTAWFLPHLGQMSRQCHGSRLHEEKSPEASMSCHCTVMQTQGCHLKHSCSCQSGIFRFFKVFYEFGQFGPGCHTFTTPPRFFLVGLSPKTLCLRRVSEAHERHGRRSCREGPKQPQNCSGLRYSVRGPNAKKIKQDVARFWGHHDIDR